MHTLTYGWLWVLAVKDKLILMEVKPQALLPPVINFTLLGH